MSNLDRPRDDDTDRWLQASNVGVLCTLCWAVHYKKCGYFRAYGLCVSHENLKQMRPQRFTGERSKNAHQTVECKEFPAIRSNEKSARTQKYFEFSPFGNRCLMFGTSYEGKLWKAESIDWERGRERERPGEKPRLKPRNRERNRLPDSSPWTGKLQKNLFHLEAEKRDSDTQPYKWWLLETTRMQTIRATTRVVTTRMFTRMVTIRMESSRGPINIRSIRLAKAAQ